MEHSRPFDVLVIGGGILGLTSAYKLLRALPGLRLGLVEKEAELASHQTGHNSGVIHTGIYYKPGSLKARLCVDGRRQMLDFAQEHGIELRVPGKLIVATDRSELGRLDDLLNRGRANGVDGLRKVGPTEMKELEPEVVGIEGIWSPGTAIIDFRAVALRLADQIRMAGGEVLLGTPVIGAHRSSDGGLAVMTATGAIHARHVLACAGLQSDRVAELFGGKGDGTRIVPFRGKYFHLGRAAAQRVHHLIYPVPDPRFPFLGVHLTPQIDGSVSAGPNAVMTLRREGYHGRGINLRDTADLLSFSGFYRLAAQQWRMGAREVWHNLGPVTYSRACRRYMPGLAASDLLPGPSGVRAQAVSADGRTVDDFLFTETANALHVRNAPSPGATASLAIADYLVDRARKTFSI